MKGCGGERENSSYLGVCGCCLCCCLCEGVCVRVRVAGLLLLHFWLYGWVGFDKKAGRERKARASLRCVSAEKWVLTEASDYSAMRESLLS